jgi:hypothetical protein
METLLTLLLFTLPVVVILRLIIGARVMKHIVALWLGAAAGFFIGFLALWTGDSPDQTTMHVFDLIDTPVNSLRWLLEHFGVGTDTAMRFWFFFHFAYWALLGGLVIFGVAAAWAKIRSDE